MLYIIKEDYMIYTGTKSLMVLRAFIDGFVAREINYNEVFCADIKFCKLKRFHEMVLNLRSFI